jgi:outer membrane protein assembly factor BamA
VKRTAVAVLLVAALAAALAGAQEVRPPERITLRVSFDGNDAVDDLLLGSAIATSPSSWMYRVPGLRSLGLGTRRTFDELEFRRDVVRLLLYYRQKGYYEARVDTVVSRGERYVSVRFRIAEGPAVRVDSVAVLGTDSIPGTASLARGLPLQRGEPFDRFLFQASADSLVAALRDRGHPFTAVYRSFDVDRRTRLARVEFDVVPGPRALVGAIAVEGNTAVRSGTVQRRLTFRQGSLFSQRELIESQRRLYQTDLFRFVNVAVAPDSLVQGADSLVRVRVQVAEARPRELRLGGGYGTIDCFRASGQATFRNVLGEARQLELTGRLSKIGVGEPMDFGLEESVCRELATDPFSQELNYLAGATITQPAFLTRRATLALSAFAEKRSEFNAYLTTSIGPSVSLRYTVRSNLPVTLSYKLSQDQTDAFPATYCIYFNQCSPELIEPFRQPIRQGQLSLLAVYNTSDSPLEPTRGRVLSIEGTLAAPWLGSEVVFKRLVGEVVRYTRIGGRRVLALRARGGLIDAGVSSIDSAAVRYVPPPDRFYAGGPSTVRGFGRNEMGPVVYVADSQRTDGTYAGLRASPVGSAALALANAEVRLPTPLFDGRIAVAAYVDVANVWAQDERSYVSDGVKVTPGLGLQLTTPLGPMRLDAGYNAYGRAPGPLYLIQGDDLVEEDPDFPGIPAGKTFLSRIQWTFSVGLSF